MPEVELSKAAAEIIPTPPIQITSAQTTTPTTPQKPTGIARIVKLIGFYCKGQNINPADITVALIKEKAYDIVEGYDDVIVQMAIDEFRKNNMK